MLTRTELRATTLERWKKNVKVYNEKKNIYLDFFTYKQ